MHPNLLGLSLGMPLAASVLENPNAFLLLDVHGDDGLALTLKLRHHGRDVLKLHIPVRMLTTLTRLAHRLKAVFQLCQEVANRALAHLMTASSKIGGQSGRALACPAQRRHRIPPAGGIDQGIKIGEQTLVDIHQALASTPGGANTLGRNLRRHGLRRSFAPGLVPGLDPAGCFNFGHAGMKWLALSVAKLEAA